MFGSGVARIAIFPIVPTSVFRPTLYTLPNVIRAEERYA